MTILQLFELILFIWYVWKEIRSVAVEEAMRKLYAEEPELLYRAMKKLENGQEFYCCSDCEDISVAEFGNSEIGRKRGKRVKRKRTFSKNARR